MIVIKRDGSKSEFDKEKIFTAISRANDSLTKKANKITKKEIEEITDEVAKACEDIKSDKNRTVEAIQDLVEEKLIERQKIKLARSYIAYREERTRIRNRSNTLYKDVFSKAFAKNIENQNANVDEASFGGRKGEAANVMLKRLALDEVISEKHRKNHEENRIYIHDLDSYLLGMSNCLSVPFDKILANGFNTRQTDVRPASSISTAFQLVAVLFQLQSLQQFGGCSATHLDTTMVPYVRKSFFKHYMTVMDIVPFVKESWLDKRVDKNSSKDISIDDEIYKGKRWFNFIKRYVWNKAMKLTVRELNQAVEGMYHNLNTLQSRSGRLDCPAA